MSYTKLQKDDDQAATRFSSDDNICLMTTTGLSKESNEDSIGLVRDGGNTIVSIGDGHWGKEAAEIATEQILSSPDTFPGNRDEAIEVSESIEKLIYAKFGAKLMDENSDFTPETSFASVRINKNGMDVFGYGDCRVIVVRSGKVVYRMNIEETWIGVFSRLGLRGRKSVSEATLFERVPIKKGDIIMLYTDGVDECIYEVPTISMDDIVAIVDQNKTAEQIAQALMDEVFNYGAEDNASMAILKH